MDKDDICEKLTKIYGDHIGFRYAQLVDGGYRLVYFVVKGYPYVATQVEANYLLASDPDHFEELSEGA